MGKTQPIHVIEKVVEVFKLIVLFPLSLQTQCPLCFADIHKLRPESAIPFRAPNKLASFAMYVAFPRSDYYDASDALSRHRQTACLNIQLRASHVHRDGLNEIT